MSSFAPPVQRDSYLYQDGFYVDVGNANRHKRATPAELTALLRPAKNAAAIKDEVGHYYEAQLIHYGLAQSKNKAVAKVRLLEALNQGSLKVPDSVVDVEKALKKQWEAENRKAKKAFQGGGKQGAEVAKEEKTPVKKPANKPAATAARKRAAEDGDAKPAKKTKTEIQKPIKSEHEDENKAKPARAPAKKMKTETQKPIKSEQGDDDKAKPARAPTKKPRPNTSSDPKPSGRGGSAAVPSSRGGKPKSTPRAAHAESTTHGTTTASPVQTSTRGYRTPQTARRGTFSGAQQRPSQSFRENPPVPTYSSSPHDSDEEFYEHRDHNASEDDSPNRDDPRYGDYRFFSNFAGLFKIWCPNMRSRYPNSLPSTGFKLKLIYDLPTGPLLGSFDLGEFDGVLVAKAPEERDHGEGMYARFEWRSRDNVYGFVIRQPVGRTGYVKVNEDGSIRGAFSGFEGEQWDFSGERVAEVDVAAGGTAEEIEMEFNRFGDPVRD